MRRDNPDMNAAELYENLEKVGWKIQRIASAVQRKAGVCDALVARSGSRLNHLLEVKRLGQRLAVSQQIFSATWPGCKHIAHSSWEAELLLAECESMQRMDALRAEALRRTKQASGGD